MSYIVVTKRKPHLIGAIYDEKGEVLVPEQLGIFVLKCKIHLSDLDVNVMELKDLVSHFSEYALTFRYDSADIIQNYINFKIQSRGMHSRVEVTNLDIQTFEIGKQVGCSNLLTGQKQRRAVCQEKE